MHRSGKSSDARATPWPVLITLAGIVLLGLAGNAPALTFTVTSTAGTPDAVPGDGICDDGTGACTLSAAVHEANADQSCQPTTVDFTVSGRIDGDLQYVFPPSNPCRNPTLSIIGPGHDVLTLGGDFYAQGYIPGPREICGLCEVDVAVTLQGLRMAGNLHVVNGGTASLADVVVAGEIRAERVGLLGVARSTVGDVSVAEGGGWGIVDSAVRSIGSHDMAGASLIRSRVSGGGLWVSSSQIQPTTTDLFVQDSIIEDSAGVGASVPAGRFRRTTIRGNRGGGLRHSPNAVSGGPLWVEDCTISGNATPDSGGGIAAAYLPLTIVRSTIVGNRADSDGDGAGDGGGIDATAFARVVSVTASILASNSDAGGEAPDCAGAISATRSLVGSSTGCSLGDATDNLVGVDPLLGALADNGGPTPTHAPLFGSPAVDATGACSGTDQRGVPRPQGAACDAGAVESTCGNGVVDRGEDCDDGTPGDGDCCSTSCRFDVEGGACPDDDEPCTLDRCDGAGVCSHRIPTSADCHENAPRASSLAITDPDGDGSYRLAWNWRGAGSRTDLGDPHHASALALCLTDGVGNLHLGATIPPAGICAGKPCWRATGSGLGYSSPDRMPDGIRRVTLRASAEDVTTVRIRGRGRRLGLRRTPLTLPVTAVLVRRDAPACWAARFTRALRNDAAAFRSRAE